MANGQWFQNIFNGKVVTTNVIFTVIIFCFAFNVTSLPFFVLKYAKNIDPKLVEKIIDFSTSGLIGAVMFVLGRLTVKTEEKEVK